MGYVESKAEGGSTTEAQSCRYTATGLWVGTHQFRREQIDLDASGLPSGPCIIRFRADGQTRTRRMMVVR